MRIGMAHAKALAALSCLALAGCAGSKAPPRAAAPAGPTDLMRYLPLKDDTVYAYDTSTDQTAEQGVLMLAVKRRRADLAELSIGGRIQRLDIEADGIRHATGGWLLKAPISEGAHFKGSFGEVRVTSVARAIDVPAGHFKGCVETVEEVSAPVRKRATTIFCPDVGIVLLQAEGDVEGDYGVERAALRSYGPRVDVNATK